jgi:hypothetical protein
MFACMFYNFGYRVHFSTFEAAKAHGEKSGFQYIILEEK